MGEYREAFVAFDVAKMKHAVAVAEGGRGGEVRFLGEIENKRATIERTIKKLAGKYDRVHVCFEAGPTGYGLYRQVRDLGHDCMVVAPALIPKRPGERVKTNRRDAVTLARLHRAGELTGVWVPVRRGRSLDAGAPALACPSGLRASGTADRLQEKVDAIADAAQRGRAPVRHATTADGFPRPSSARTLNGDTVRRLGLTLAGNRRARCALVEAAWTYRFPARVSETLRARIEGQPKPVRDIAWKAQIRLCARYRRLSAAGKKPPVVVAAIAREMAAFLWAIGREAMPS